MDGVILLLCPFNLLIFMDNEEVGRDGQVKLGFQ